MSAQDHFTLANQKKSDKIDVKIINNLIIIPITVNGTELNFLLDSGAAATILFQVDNYQRILLNETTPTSIAGAGSGSPVDALESLDNTIQIGDARSTQQPLYAILDERVDFSPQLGFPVQGVIGYQLFKDFIVEVNYRKKHIILHEPSVYDYDSCRNCQDEALTFISKRPVISTKLKNDGNRTIAPLLIDSGSSDAVWLFDYGDTGVNTPEVHFKDYLGFGLNGSITGVRARIPEFSIGRYKLDALTSAFPDSTSIKNLQITNDRVGTIGGEILRRFTTIFNYKKQTIRFIPNSDFSDPFTYNKSGLIIKHGEYTIEKEILSSNDRNVSRANEKTQEIVNIFKTFQNYRKVLEPTYIVDEVLPNTPSERAGLVKGDQILTINGRNTSKLRLDQITNLFFQEAGKIIRLEIRRDNTKMKISFALKELLP